jgi:hypothetical protein
LSRHAVIKIRLRAQIGEFNFDDVVQYASSWAINSIPTASIMVAVGRNVKTQKLAKIHEAVKTLTADTLAEVFLTTTVVDINRATAGVPNGKEIKIFSGKLSGTGWQRTENGAHFTIHMLHWLAALNHSSSVSASLHPGSPADLTYPAVYPSIGLRNTTPNSSTLPSWVPNLTSSSVNTGSFTDMWGKILLPWMETIANDDPYDRAQNTGNGKGDPDALDALSRMAPNPEGQPLELDLRGVSGAVLADGLRTALVNEIGGSWINTTLWGKLVGEWSPAYWFSVIPRVEDALIVPFTGGLAGKQWAVIGDEDYANADLNAQLHQVLKAVGIVHPIGTSSSFDLGAGLPQVSRSGFLGFYRPETVTKGMVLLKDAPKWLSDPAVVHMLSFYAEDANRTLGTNTAMDEAGTGGEQNPKRDIGNDISQLKGLASAYAHQWYVLEALKGRTGEIAGKLRFDIAPGSNVLVIAGGARNIPQADAVTEDIYATVTQVAYVINAEAQQAGTAFSLAHIRTAKENSDPGTSVEKPPLYKNAWPGAKLVPAAPGPEQDE